MCEDNEWDEQKKRRYIIYIYISKLSFRVSTKNTGTPGGGGKNTFDTISNTTNNKAV